MNWLQTYSPKTWDEFDIHLNVKKEMDNWMNNVKAKNTDTYFLYLCGPSGTGKTTMSRLFFEKYGFDIIEWNAIDLKQSKTIEEMFLKTLYKQNIQILIKEKVVHSSIILEECDCLQNVGKEIISKVTENIRNMEYQTPIICTSNELECDSIKNGKIILFERVSPDYILNLTKKICKAENWLLRMDVIQFILKNMDTDIRNWIMQLESIYSFFKSKKNEQNITLYDIQKFFLSTQPKNNDLTLYNWTNKLFYKDTSWTDLVSMSDTDSIIFPMMVYSNIQYNTSNMHFLKSKQYLSSYYIKQEVFRDAMKKCYFDELQGYSTLYALGSVYVLKKIPEYNLSSKKEISFPSNIYNKKYTECTHRKHINQMMYDYNISRIELNYWSFLLYMLYLNHENDTVLNNLICFYNLMYPNILNNEEINEIFKCDYLRVEIKKRKKENILKTIYDILNINIKKNNEKKKRGRPRKNK